VASAASRSACLLCEGTQFQLCYSSPATGSVTSDCKPWPKTLDTLVCTTCGHLQKASDPEAVDEVNSVYLNYELNHLSDWGEQFIFQGDSVRPSTRSSVLLETLASDLKLGPKGRMLDIGCGNGASLLAFSGLRKGWELAGFEQSDSLRSRILSIPGVTNFWSGDLASIPPHSFDLITVVHVLEHVARPVPFMQQVRRLLAPGGVLLIQVPDAVENPFDMLVTDHYSHFSPELLHSFMLRSGFETAEGNLKWVAKEITLLLSGGRTMASHQPPSNQMTPIRDRFMRNGTWLHAIAREAVDRASRGRLGVFGTAIAGTWMGAIVGDRLAFFADEDDRRLGKEHLRRPIVHPRNLSADDSVYLAFPHEIAKRIQERLSSSYKAEFVVPPAP
jgi:SAM-dependent methyltransferase